MAVQVGASTADHVAHFTGTSAQTGRPGTLTVACPTSSPEVAVTVYWAAASGSVGCSDTPYTRA
ncbi:hypothetical protein DY218_27245 [Streptomyces triticagri]|uniref:Uncharacterized protein n=1 Tax=Streptomyces triticagri TaxID=2293568 RepID=A0A372LY59_9ACTN|nr:hypothetical protein DY218_27245 [Streptomyces triticagri]